MSSSLGDVLASLALERVNATFFVGTQMSAPGNHIVGGHIAAQALMAASQTAPGRPPHSAHTYFLRPGDSRRPVDFEVVTLQEGRTFSARRVTARQDGQMLLEAMSSFKAVTNNDPGSVYQPTMPTVPDPETLPRVSPHIAESTGDDEGKWGSLRWYERRVVQAQRVPPGRFQIWWRPDGIVPTDPILTATLVAYLSAVTLSEATFALRPKHGASAQRDHAVWFHRPATLTDWLFYDQSSPTSADSLALATGSMYNRTGELVCSVREEVYFPPSLG